MAINKFLANKLFLKRLVIGFIAVVVLTLFIFLINMLSPINKSNEYRYVALGDSYTKGEGVSAQLTWPVTLTQHLVENGVKISLFANPSVSGWTTQQVVDYELPIFDKTNPTFATLLIGVNDWVQGVSSDDFDKNLKVILDRMLLKLSNKKNLVVLTIPDFSSTPAGSQYAKGRDIQKGLTVFNDIIKNEAALRGLFVVDLYPISQKMKDDTDLVAKDGLHPSAKEYAIWEQAIYPVVYGLLKGN